MTILREQPDLSRSRDIPSSFETARLLVRRYQPDDASWYAPMSVQNREHLERYESGNAAMAIETETDAAAVIQDFIASWNARSAFFLGAFRKATGVFVAQIYIGVANWDLPELELGYFADATHTGQGFVTEAAQGALRFCFRELGAHRVRLECDDTNVPSYRVAERCGMIREGHLRENHRHADGSLTGTFLYGILRHELNL